jgi:hypothetical protein
VERVEWVVRLAAPARTLAEEASLMSGWTDSELATIETADEIHIAPDRADHSTGPAVPIWVVRVDDDLYVRSYRGPSGSWYRRARRNGSGRIRVGGIDRAVRFTAVDAGVRAKVDEAYSAKYGRYSSSLVRPMISDTVAETTLQLQPTTS